MTEGLYLLLIVIGAFSTAFVIAAGTKGSVGGVRVDRRTGIVISAFVFVVWGLVAISSYEITVYSGGQAATEEFPEVALLAIPGAAASLFVCFQAAIEEVRDTGGM